MCGVFLVLAGGQLVVREAATLAARLGISSLVIGVVVIGFGTSAPELATGVRAALADAPALAFGNAIGSSLANQLIVLPLSALLLPVEVQGLTLLSFGTCMPEHATAIIAARRRQTDIVVGSVLGSCLFNLLAVAGSVQARCRQFRASGLQGLRVNMTCRC